MDVAGYMNFDSSFFDTYATLGHYLSRGASGNVYGPIQWNDKHLAIKQVTFADGKVTEELKANIEEKKNMWSLLQHKNLMRIHSVDLNQLPKAMLIVMEFAGGGSLSKTLKSLGTENKLPIGVASDWAKQIAEGMLYLHQKSIVHRDLKSSNILLMEKFHIHHSPLKVTLRITDFDEVKDHDHTTTFSFVGTCAYMAPEVLMHQLFSKTSDVWSYGVVIWEMLSGDVPHKELEPTTIMYKSMIGQFVILPIEKSFPDDCKLLLCGCWKTTWSERLSFQEIVSIVQRWDVLPEKYQSRPVLIDTISKKTAEEGRKSITGLAILDEELFIVTERSSEIDVYDSIKLSFRRRLNLAELFNPWNIGSCNRYKCLYIFDGRGIARSGEILRVDPNGTLIKNWSTENDYGYGLSVTDESNIVLTVYKKSKLNEYSPEGLLIREIYLSSDTGICNPLHAVKLANGHFVVSHGSRRRDLHRVCLVDSDGKLVESFGGKSGSDIAQMNWPVYLSVHKNGFVMVADKRNNRVVLLDSKLEFDKEILSSKNHGLQCPWRILPVESSGRMFVAQEQKGLPGLIKIFQF